MAMPYPPYPGLNILEVWNLSILIINPAQFLLIHNQGKIYLDLRYFCSVSSFQKGQTYQGLLYFCPIHPNDGQIKAVSQEDKVLVGNSNSCACFFFKFKPTLNQLLRKYLFPKVHYWGNLDIAVLANNWTLSSDFVLTFGAVYVYFDFQN